MILLENIFIQQGQFRMEDVSLNVPSGAYCVLMGGTGSGKTTLLEVICGLRRPTRGLVVLHGNDVTDARPADRGVGYVPQDGALFKTMTVFDQIAFPLAIRRTPRDETSSRVKEIANLLSIGQLLDRGPAGLSGGERQRVALGRALSFRPSILLLDEPLVALDEETRNQIMGLLKAVQHSTGVTVLHVTHDATEARCLGDMCVRIDQGRLNRCDVQPKPEAER